MLAKGFGLREGKKKKNLEEMRGKNKASKENVEEMRLGVA